MRRSVFCASLCLFVAILSGCTLWPSTWRLGGSPLDREKASQAHRQQLSGDAVGHAQSAVHKASTALDAAPASRPVAVARDFLNEAKGLLDQAHGAPTAAQAVEWRALSLNLLSDNPAVRAAAEKERSAQADATAQLSEKLARATAAAERANAKALTYASEREDLADFAGKLKLGFFGLIALVVLGTVLSLASRFFPALGLASKVVNAVVAPGITFVAHRAEDGLRKVGQGMAKIRAAVPDAEEFISRNFDGLADADHQRLIAAGSSAAGRPPAS